MIISHKYNLIFFKVPKTSGTLFELGFSKYLNKNDISTYLPEKFENLTKLSFSRNNSIRLTKLDLILSSILKYRNFKKKFYFVEHSKPQEVKTFMRSEYENYYKIMFIRHPWKAFRSKYFWHIGQKRKFISFYDFYEKLFDRFINDFYKFYYLDNGDKTFDFLINYENILSDFEFLSKKINLFKSMKKFYLEQKINVSDSENKKLNEDKIIIKNEKYDIIKKLYENTLKQNF
jgi:hypothetical protein